MGWYVYILGRADGHCYYGCADDLSQRLGEHQAGLYNYTAPRRPVAPQYFEEHETLAQARRRERSFRKAAHAARRSLS